LKSMKLPVLFVIASICEPSISQKANAKLCSEVNIWKHIDSISGKIDINKSVKAEKQGLTINDFKKIIRDVKEDAPEDIDEEKEDEISEIAETSIEEQEMSDSDAELEDKTIPSDFEELPELEELDLEE